MNNYFKTVEINNMSINEKQRNVNTLDKDGKQFDSPHGSTWIVAVDIGGMVSIIKAPNIHYGFFDMGNDAESVGIPFESSSPAGLYEWTCSYPVDIDRESGLIEDVHFEVEKEIALSFKHKDAE